MQSSESQEKYEFKKRPGTAGGLDGYLYEIHLFILANLRAERDTDTFFLASNMADIGVFDDLIIKYTSSVGNKEKANILLLQAKHVENSQKGKITIEKFKNKNSDDGKFYLGKYFADYLKIREKFYNETCQNDPVFKSNFKEIDLSCIIYTNSTLHQHFDKSRIVEVDGNILSTNLKENKGDTFSFSFVAANSDLIDILKSISRRERIKLLAEAVVSCFCGKLNHVNMITNESILTYHVFLSRTVIDVKEEVKENRNRPRYREGMINNNFLNIDNKDQLEKELQEEIFYEYAKCKIFSRNNNSDLGNKNEQKHLVNKISKSLKSSGKVDADVIEKLGGNAIVLDTKSRKLKFADQNLLKNDSTKEFIGHLKNQVDNLEGYEFDIPYELLNTKLRKEMEKKPLKLHIRFGNINPTFKKQEHFINKLIQLFEHYHCEKVIKINDDIDSHSGILTKSDVTNIGNLVGNLLIFDQKEKMLRLANEESLDGNNLLLLQKLKTTAQSKGLELDEYLFDIKVKTFPRYSLDNEDEDMVSIEEFLSKLKVFAAQANNENLKEIIKHEMKDLYKLTINEVDENYLKIKDKAEKAWKEVNYYLLKNNDIFAKILRYNIQFNVTEHAVSFTGRDEEIENLHKKLQNGGEYIMSHVTCLTGLGGIGKTELSRKYISQHKNCYDGNLIWIDSRNVQSLIESFRKLARYKLDISLIDEDGYEKDIEFIVEEVYRFFSRRKCLFIFDDVESYKDIKMFLPQSSYFNDTKPQILITSRCRDWDTEEVIKVIDLKELKSDEAVKFVTDIVKNYNVSQEKDAEELTNLFQCLPLALRHAVSYINQEDKNFKKRGNNSFKISDYLKICQQQKIKFRSDDNQTVLATWNTTLENIAEDRLYGRQAIDILNIMAYFNPNKIDVGVLFTMPETDERWNSLNLLDAYSMIDLRNGIADIHSLVQEATRQKLERENKVEEVLERALKGIDISKISKDHLCDITSIWDHSSKYPNLVQKFGRDLLQILFEVRDTNDYDICKALAHNYNNIYKGYVRLRQK